MDQGSGFPIALIALFPIAFVGIWVLAIVMIARAGWSSLAAHHAATGDPSDSAARFSWQSLNIGKNWRAANYSNCVNAWLDSDALYLRPALMFRPFHPLLRLRWSDIVSIEPRGAMLTKRMRVVLRGGAPELNLAGKLGPAVLAAWQRHGQTGSRISA